MKTRTELLVAIYESCENGVIDEVTRDAMLEACNEEECTEEKKDNGPEEDEVEEFKKKIEELKEKVAKAKTDKAIENIKDKAKDAMDELVDVADDKEIEDKLEELYDEFIDDIDDEDDDSDDEDDDSDEEDEVEESVKERIAEVRLSIYESCTNGYITEETRDELLTLIEESLRDTIVNAAKKGKELIGNDALKGLSPTYTDDGLATGLKMMKQGKLEQAEKEKKASELRKRVALATANAGVGK